MGERTIIIGGGIAGATAAYWLARERARYGELSLFESATRLGAHASGRSAAIHRVAVDDPVTRALAVETLEWLEASPRGTGERPFLDAIGLVVCEGDSPDSPLPAWAEDLTARGLAQPLTDDERSARAPHCRTSGVRAWWLPRAGRVGAHALVQGLVTHAERDGLRVEANSAVRRILHADGRVTGVALQDGRELTADNVVIAAGAWSTSLGEAVGCPLPLAQSTRHLFVTGPIEGFDARAPIVWDDRAGFYLRAYDGGLLVCPCDQAPASPEVVAPRYLTDPSAEARARELADTWLATSNAVAVERGWCGLRDRSPDDRPVLGWDPRLSGLAWCAGLGGHGFSVGVAAGRALADLLAGRDPRLPASVGPERFTHAPVDSLARNGSSADTDAEPARSR